MEIEQSEIIRLRRISKVSRKMEMDAEIALGHNPAALMQFCRDVTVDGAYGAMLSSMNYMSRVNYENLIEASKKW